jgi:lysyl-tRNA synthetase class 2
VTEPTGLGSPDDDRTGLAESPLTALRLEKLAALRSEGIDPYPVGAFTPDAHAADLAAEFDALGPGESTGRRVTVAGRLVGRRDLGKLVFGVLQDGTGRIQLFVQAATLGDRMDAFRSLDIGDWIGVGGEVVTTKRGELSVKVDEFVLLSKSLRPLPEKWQGLQDVEKRHRRRYLDLIVNDEARATMVARSRIVRELRDAFERRGFIEVETPMLQIQAGGALAKPFVTHHNALGLDMYLRIAPELYLKRLLVGGVERVFELNRNFRNEGTSPRHNPEFTMLEAYLAYADYNDVARLIEEVISETAVAVLGTSVVTFEGRDVDLTAPFHRTTVLAALNEHTGVEFDTAMDYREVVRRAGSLGIEVDGSWGVGKVIMEVFDARVESELWQPTFVFDYPKEISPLARVHREDPGLTERFELIIAGREMANAFSELNDPLDQRERFEAQAISRAEGDEEAHPIDEDFLTALEYGMPPAGGLGIGVDRVVMILTGRSSIREVILFPALRPEK